MVDVTPAIERIDLRPLREHRSFIIVFVLSAMVSALAYTYLFSERYGAELTIFFKPADVTLLSAHKTQALGSPPPTPPLRVVSETISRLVGSEVILSTVVSRLHLDADTREISGPWYERSFKELKYALMDLGSDAWSILRFGTIFRDSPASAAIARLRREIKTSSEDSYVYTLKVTDKSPQRAAAIANEVGIAVVDLLHRDEQQELGSQSRRLTALRDDQARGIEVIERQMQDLLASNQVVSITDELAKVTESAAKLRQQQVDTIADLRQSDAKAAAEAEKLRVATPPGAARDETAAAVRRPSRINADDYAKLTSSRLNAEVNSASLRARLEALDRSYVALLPRLQVLSRIQAQYDLLTSKLKSAKQDYAVATDALQEVAIRIASQQNELRIQAKALEQPVPLSPIKIYHVAAAGALAALIALGLAYVLDYFDIHLFLPPPPAPGWRRARPAAPEPAFEPGVGRIASD